MTEWLRPTERPEWGRDDVEWWWTPSDAMRPLEPSEEGRKCSTARCPNAAVLVWVNLIGGAWSKYAAHERRRFKCDEHAYGDYLIANGRVYVKRPRLDLLEAAQ